MYQTNDYKIIKNRADLDSLVRKLWETDYFGLAMDGTSPAGSGEQSGSYNETAPSSIAIATAAGVSFLIDLENFEEGREAAGGITADLSTLPESPPSTLRRGRGGRRRRQFW